MGKRKFNIKRSQSASKFLFCTYTSRALNSKTLNILQILTSAVLVALLEVKGQQVGVAGVTLRIAQPSRARPAMEKLYFRLFALRLPGWPLPDL